jgi:hypothetical protein
MAPERDPTGPPERTSVVCATKQAAADQTHLAQAENDDMFGRRLGRIDWWI